MRSAADDDRALRNAREDTYYRRVGAALRRRREELGMTQLAAARAAGVKTAAAISMVERGERGRNIATLSKYAAAVGTDLPGILAEAYGD